MSGTTDDRQDFARAVLAAGVQSIVVGALYLTAGSRTDEPEIAAWIRLSIVMGASIFALSILLRRLHSNSLQLLALFACFALALLQVTPMGMWMLLGSFAGEAGITTTAPVRWLLIAAHIGAVAVASRALAVGMRPSQSR